MPFPIYFDEDSQARAVVAGVRLAGIDCHTSQEESMDGRTDEEQLRHTAERRWTLVTRNEDHFLRLHASYLGTRTHHAGIIVVRQRPSLGVGEQIRRFARMQEQLHPSDMVDWVEYLSRW